MRTVTKLNHSKKNRWLNQARITVRIGISELHGDCAANLHCPPVYFDLQVDTATLDVPELRFGEGAQG